MELKPRQLDFPEKKILDEKAHYCLKIRIVIASSGDGFLKKKIIMYLLSTVEALSRNIGLILIDDGLVLGILL